MDSNAIYKDPFIIKGYNKILNKLAKHEDVKIYVSKVVYEEVYRGHKVLLENEIEEVKKSQTRISQYLDDKKQKFIFVVELEELLIKFEDSFVSLEADDKLKIVDHDKDVLDYIVEIDMYEKEPFVQQDKKEIRDAIIWYSYEIFIQKNKLTDCFFISNNTKEFGDEGANKTPKNSPYNLHPQLCPSSMLAYRTVQEFLYDNDTQVKEYFKEINKQILSEELSDKVYEELEEGLAEELTTKYFREQISTSAYDYLSNMQPEDIHRDYFMGGFVMPTGENDISEIRFVEVDIYGDDVTVSVDVDIDLPVEIHLYNPVYDDRDDKFQYNSTDTVRVVQNVILNIPVNFEKDVDEEQFSFKEYIEGQEPENVEISIIDYSNIDHVDMFDEEEYEEVF
ncbi:PIN domain-containing protein [Bacillus sp. P14.5]|uniref:PIN domain-containing protein n=1 Tax=Bacillus sp. P14.5 TaxID=1983400 RepID=UPI0013B066ED|nr:PIN domain-containing protein [Bacillus sp. P14.5]